MTSSTQQSTVSANAKPLQRQSMRLSYAVRFFPPLFRARHDLFADSVLRPCSPCQCPIWQGNTWCSVPFVKLVCFLAVSFLVAHQAKFSRDIPYHHERFVSRPLIHLLGTLKDPSEKPLKTSFPSAPLGSPSWLLSGINNERSYKYK